MKKIFWYTILFVSMFFVGNIETYALDVDSDDVGARTYVIGTHMFTRETSDVYNGQLTTKHIMLAAKTIEGNSLEDMIIYYKNPMGIWIDGLTGEVIEVPEIFDIQYKNTVDAIDTSAITISFHENAFGASEDGSVGRRILLDSVNMATGVELYYATSEDGEYQLLKNVLTSDIEENTFDTMVPKGSHYYYKVRLYYNNGDEIIYGDYSNVIDIDNRVHAPVISFSEDAFGANEEGGFGRRILIDPINPSTGVELYYATSEDGEYQLLKNILTLDIEENTFDVMVPAACHYYYKVRLYYDNGSEIIYGDYSNVIDIDNSIYVPTISFSETDFGGIADGSIGRRILLDGMATGVELYYATSEEGEYQLLRSASSEEIVEMPLDVMVPKGSHYYYKVRLYQTTANDILYGDYSNILDLDNTLVE